MSTKIIGISSGGIWPETESSLGTQAARRDYSAFILRRISGCSRPPPIDSRGELDTRPVMAARCLTTRREAQYPALGGWRLQKTGIMRKILINSLLCRGGRSIQPERRPVKPVAGRSGKSVLPVVHELPKAGVLKTGRGLREIP